MNRDQLTEFFSADEDLKRLWMWGKEIQDDFIDVIERENLSRDELMLAFRFFAAGYYGNIFFLRMAGDNEN